MNVLIYSALYRDNNNGKCQKAGVAFRFKAKVGEKELERDFETISTDRTYGDLWLSGLLELLEKLHGSEATSIKVITNQIEAGKMANKIERILIEALEKNKSTESEIEHLVYKDGRYSPRPNNDLYTKLVVKLVEMARNHCYFSQDHLPSKHTMDLVKSLHRQIAPNKVLIDKTKPKSAPKKKAPL
jgi:hypothetical protein